MCSYAQRGFECFVGDTIFIAEDSHCIPLMRVLIRRSSFCKAGNIVLDLRVESLPKLEHNMGALQVVGPHDHLAKFIHILVDGSGPLEVPRSFEISPCRLELVLGAKLADELLYKLLPHIVGEASYRLVISHVAIHESCSTVTLHEGECPHDPRMVISELMRHEIHVQFARIQEGSSFRTISQKVVWTRWFQVVCARSGFRKTFVLLFGVVAKMFGGL
jgi:hypothetical protein